MSMTARDLQALRLASRGRTAKEIAGELGISRRMVEFHLLRARKDLGATNTVDAVTRLLTMKRIRKTEVEKQGALMVSWMHEEERP